MRKYHDVFETGKAYRTGEILEELHTALVATSGILSDDLDHEEFEALSNIHAEFIAVLMKGLFSNTDTRRLLQKEVSKIILGTDEERNDKFVDNLVEKIAEELIKGKEEDKTFAEHEKANPERQTFSEFARELLKEQEEEK